MKRIALALIMLFIAAKADAFVFQPTLDHCASTDGGRWLGYGENGNACGTSFFQGSNVAYQFNIDTPIYVSSIEAWIAYNDFDLNTTAGANVAIYNGTGGNEHTGIIPTGDKIFSKRFSFPVDPHNSSPADWRGVTDFSFDLKPGTYWVAFEEGTRGTFVSGKEGLKMAAIHNPEPATMFLMGGGLLAMLRKRRQWQAAQKS